MTFYCNAGNAILNKNGIQRAMGQYVTIQKA